MLGALGEMSLLLPAAPINPDGSCSGLEVPSAEVMLTIMGTTHRHSSAGWPRMTEAGVGKGLSSALGVGFLQGNLHK